MSIRPLDMTITVQRTTEINREQTGEHARPEVQQQHAEDKMTRDVQRQEQQVVQTNKTEEGKVDRDGRGNSGGESKKKKRTPREEAKKSAAKANESMFDVSI